jgi:hypothetical protein
MKKRCREEEEEVTPLILCLLPRDLQYYLLSCYLRYVKFSQMEMYLHIKYLHATEKTQLCLSESLNYLRHQLELSMSFMQTIFQCETVWDLISNPLVFTEIAKYFTLEKRPHKLILCEAKNCVIVARQGICLLHHHGVITYCGHIIPFQEFIVGFKKRINGKKNHTV